MAKEQEYMPDRFISRIYRDEPVFRARQPITASLPPLLKQARMLERKNYWRNPKVVFLKQARLLADYEDDFEFAGNPVRYYPTYMSFTDNELRGYFSFRTRARKGIRVAAPLSFIFLWIYEILNYIGVEYPLAGYEKLQKIRTLYGAENSTLISYLDNWIQDYIIYYNLDKELLAESPQVNNDQYIKIIENIGSESRDNVMSALRCLAPKWLKRSRFYAEYQEDMDEVIFRIFRKMDAYYAKRCKRNLVGQFFGSLDTEYCQLFRSAVFCDPLKHDNYEYVVDSQCVYRCRGGFWTVSRRFVSPRGIRKLGNLLKTVDRIMREEYGYGRPIQSEFDVKWVLKLVREETLGLLAEKKAGEKNKLKIDFSCLDKIRSDASLTCDKLIVEEDREDEISAEPVIQEIVSVPRYDLLSPAEYRFMRCLLYGGDLGWIREEGYLLSVLADGINEKLYDMFEDSVLDDQPRVIEDYIEDLKEIIPE